MSSRMPYSGKTRSTLDTKAYWDKWKPTPGDIQWVRDLLGKLNHNGIWEHSEGQFRVDHQNKVMTLERGVRGQIYWRTSRVCGLLGWKVSASSPVMEQEQQNNGRN